MGFLWDCAFLSFRLLGMDTFNPRILDACIRDVSSYLSDSQKVDLLLYVLRSLVRMVLTFRSYTPYIAPGNRIGNYSVIGPFGVTANAWGFWLVYISVFE